MFKTTSTKPSAIDLFAGCGGMSAGLEAAGFEVLAAAEIDKRYFQTHMHNFPNTIHLTRDLSTTSPSSLVDSLGLKVGQLDLLAGGPPCQGFSKNVPRVKRYLTDPKNQLVNTFLDYCESFMPKAVLMENVAEMRNGFEQSYTEEIVERLGVLGYAVTHAALLAADFGVPQRRRRAFFIGVRDTRSPNLPTPTHASDGNCSLFTEPHVNVWDAIGDLPSLQHGEGVELTRYETGAFSPYQVLVRENSENVRNHIARKLEQKQLDRLASLAPGQGLKDLPEHLRPRSGYSGAYGRLTKDMVAPTITRWVFHPGSGRFGHPVDSRVLTIREAARLQGFSDRFSFVGSYNEQAGQIGNAVPPLLAQRVGEAILQMIR